MHKFVDNRVVDNRVVVDRESIVVEGNKTRMYRDYIEDRTTFYLIIKVLNYE
jgi:hypothetical protein